MVSNLDKNDISAVLKALQKAKHFKKKWDARKLSETDKESGLCRKNLVIGWVLKYPEIRKKFKKQYPEYYKSPVFPIKHPTLVNYNAFIRCPKYDRRTQYGRERYKFLCALIDLYEEILTDYEEL